MLILLQANYQFSPFVAEMANSFSNVVTIFLGLYGGYVALQQKLPTRYPVGFLVRLVLATLGTGLPIDDSYTFIGYRCYRNRKLRLSRVFVVRSAARRRVADGYCRVVCALSLVRLTERVRLRCRPWFYPPHRLQHSFPYLIVCLMTPHYPQALTQRFFPM